MQIGFRADASSQQGTGHVMRCITLARSLIKLGVNVTFYSNIHDSLLITELMKKFEINVKEVPKNSFDFEYLIAENLDLLVVDSYEIESSLINSYSNVRPILAIIDGSSRKIHAQIYLDQNIQASGESLITSNKDAVKLTGSKYALIREEVRAQMWVDVSTPTRLEDASILCISGGTDPKKAITKMAELVANFEGIKSTFIAPTSLHDQLSNILSHTNHKIIEFTQDLPSLLASSTSAISAAGTTAWEISTIGIPSAFTVVAENQIESASAIEKLGLGVSLSNIESFEKNDQKNIEAVRDLLLDPELRKKIFTNCRQYFDGFGATRVAQEMLTFLT